MTSSNLSPRSNQATTYNYNYRDPQQMPSNSSFGNNSNMNFNSSQNFDYSSNSNGSFRGAQQQQQLQQQQTSIPHMPPINNQYNQPIETQLEREANIRQLQRANSMPKGQSELNRISNKLYNDNQPTRDYPNHSYWFGRAGTHKTIIG